MPYTRPLITDKRKKQRLNFRRTSEHPFLHTSSCTTGVFIGSTRRTTKLSAHSSAGSGEGDMHPTNMPSHSYSLPQGVSYGQDAQRAANEQNWNLEASDQPRPEYVLTQNSSQFRFHNTSSDMSVPGDNLRLGGTPLILVGMTGGGANVERSSFSGPPPQLPSNASSLSYEAPLADLKQFRNAHSSFPSMMNYSASRDDIVDNRLLMNPHTPVPLNRSQTHATPYDNPLLLDNRMDTGMGEAPWSPYAALSYPTNSRAAPIPNFANKLSTLLPPQQQQRRRRKSSVSSKSVPAYPHSSTPHHGRHPPFGQIPSRSSSRRLSVAEELNSALRPSSPNPSITPSHVDEILHCEKDGCQVVFKGAYRRGNRSRHWRQMHYDVKVYSCEDRYCEKNFNRSDARLKHYRKHHPELSSGPALSRKLYTSI